MQGVNQLKYGRLLGEIEMIGKHASTILFGLGTNAELVFAFSGFSHS